MFFSLAPDRQWLALMQQTSRGALARGGERQHVFDSDGTFILTYAARRAIFETTENLRVRRTFGSGIIDKGREHE